MSQKKQVKQNLVIDAVINLIKSKVDVDQQEILEKFVRLYYRNTADEDLAETEPENLYGAVLSHWNFAKNRKPGTGNVRVYNPQFEKHGWQSSHTIVEIVVDDKPFLVDSIRMALNARSLTTHLVIHPVINIRRDSKGHITEVLETDDKANGAMVEAVMHIEVDRHTEKNVLDSITDGVISTLNDVSVAVEDWQPMCKQLSDVVESLKTNPPPIEADDLEPSQAFLEWIADNHFALLGYREYMLTKSGDLRNKYQKVDVATYPEALQAQHQYDHLI